VFKKPREFYKRDYINMFISFIMKKSEKQEENLKFNSIKINSIYSLSLIQENIK